MGLELALNMESHDGSKREATKARENPLQTDELKNIYDRIIKTHTKYQNMKKALGNPNTGDPSLNLISVDMPWELLRLGNCMFK